MTPSTICEKIRFVGGGGGGGGVATSNMSSYVYLWITGKINTKIDIMATN